MILGGNRFRRFKYKNISLQIRMFCLGTGLVRSSLIFPYLA
jgi:hypothetical protein